MRVPRFVKSLANGELAGKPLKALARSLVARHRGHQARIDPTANIRADFDVATHMHANRVAQALAHLLHEIGFGVIPI
ncbi:hypothetical protein D3C87_2115390 [compost metagenome]